MSPDRHRSMREHLGSYALGHLSADEEVALDPSAVEVLGLSDAYETGTGFLVTPVIGWLLGILPSQDRL